MAFQNCNPMKSIFFGGLQISLFKSLWLHMYSTWSLSRPMNFKLQDGCQPCCYGDTRSQMPDGYWPSPKGRKNETVYYSFSWFKQEKMDCNALCHREMGIEATFHHSLSILFWLVQVLLVSFLAKWCNVTHKLSLYVTTWLDFTNLEYHVL